MMGWVLFAFTLPWALTTWLVGVLSVAAWLAEPSSLRFEQNGIMTLEWRPWFAKLWRYSTTLGRVVWYQPGLRSADLPLDERVERHESSHVRQVEDLMVLAFVVALVVLIVTGDWLLALGIWWSGGVWQLPNFVTAVMRYGWRGIYRDAEHERSAYAQTHLWPNNESWWDYRDEQRKDVKF